MHRSTALAYAREFATKYVEHQAIPIGGASKSSGENAAAFIAALHDQLTAYFEKVKDE